MNVIFLPYLVALIIGSFASYLIDKINIYGTDIPIYGFFSTINFTEEKFSETTFLLYWFLILLKGVFYLLPLFLMNHLLRRAVIYSRQKK